MRVCTKCLVEKDEASFFVKNRKTGRIHAQCKVCYKSHRSGFYKLHYQQYHEHYLHRAKIRREMLRNEFRTNMMAYLRDKSCTVCNEDDIRVLEFDHIEPAKKLFTIAKAVSLGYKWDEVLLEIEKCQILCANCHKKRTSEQFKWYKAM